MWKTTLSWNIKHDAVRREKNRSSFHQGSKSCRTRCGKIPEEEGSTTRINCTVKDKPYVAVPIPISLALEPGVEEAIFPPTEALWTPKAKNVRAIRADRETVAIDVSGSTRKTILQKMSRTIMGANQIEFVELLNGWYQPRRSTSLSFSMIY